MPLAPPVVRGLINLRGQIVTAIDLRRRLELQDRPADQLPVNVVVHTDDGAVSLLVDEIGDVLEVSGDGLRAAAGDPRRDGAGADPRRLQAEGSAAADPRHRADRQRVARRSGPGTDRLAGLRATRIQAIRPTSSIPNFLGRATKLRSTRDERRPRNHLRTRAEHERAAELARLPAVVPLQRADQPLPGGLRVHHHLRQRACPGDPPRHRGRDPQGLRRRRRRHRRRHRSTASTRTSGAWSASFGTRPRCRTRPSSRSATSRSRPSINGIFGPGNDVLGYIVNWEDVSQRRRTEAEQSRLASMLENSPDQRAAGRHAT